MSIFEKIDSIQGSLSLRLAAKKRRENFSKKPKGLAAESSLPPGTDEEIFLKIKAQFDSTLESIQKSVKEGYDAIFTSLSQKEEKGDSKPDFGIITSELRRIQEDIQSKKFNSHGGCPFALPPESEMALLGEDFIKREAQTPNDVLSSSFLSLKGETNHDLDVQDAGSSTLNSSMILTSNDRNDKTKGPEKKMQQSNSTSRLGGLKGLTSMLWRKSNEEKPKSYKMHLGIQNKKPVWDPVLKRYLIDGKLPTEEEKIEQAPPKPKKEEKIEGKTLSVSASASSLLMASDNSRILAKRRGGLGIANENKTGKKNVKKMATKWASGPVLNTENLENSEIENNVITNGRLSLSKEDFEKDIKESLRKITDQREMIEKFKKELEIVKKREKRAKMMLRNALSLARKEIIETANSNWKISLQAPGEETEEFEEKSENSGEAVKKYLESFRNQRKKDTLNLMDSLVEDMRCLVAENASALSLGSLLGDYGFKQANDGLLEPRDVSCLTQIKPNSDSEKETEESLEEIGEMRKKNQKNVQALTEAIQEMVQRKINEKSKKKRHLEILDMCIKVMEKMAERNQEKNEEDLETNQALNVLKILCESERNLEEKIATLELENSELKENISEAVATNERLEQGRINFMHEYDKRKEEIVDLKAERDLTVQKANKQNERLMLKIESLEKEKNEQEKSINFGLEILKQENEGLMRKITKMEGILSEKKIQIEGEKAKLSDLEEKLRVHLEKIKELEEKLAIESHRKEEAEKQAEIWKIQANLAEEQKRMAEKRAEESEELLKISQNESVQNQEKMEALAKKLEEALSNEKNQNDDEKTQELNLKIEELEGKIADYIKKIEEEEENSKGLWKQIWEAKEEAKLSKEKSENAENKAQSAKNSLNEVQKEKAELLEQNQRLNDNIKSHFESQEDSQRIISNLEESLRQKRETIIALNKEHEKEKVTCSQLRVQIEHLSREKDEAFEKLNGIQGEKSQKGSSIDQGEKSTFEEENNSLKEEMKKLENKIKNAAKLMTKLRVQKETQKTLEAENQNLSTELFETKRQLRVHEETQRRLGEISESAKSDFGDQRLVMTGEQLTQFLSSSASEVSQILIRCKECFTELEKSIQKEGTEKKEEKPTLNEQEKLADSSEEIEILQKRFNLLKMDYLDLKESHDDLAKWNKEMPVLRQKVRDLLEENDSLRELYRQSLEQSK